MYLFIGALKFNLPSESIPRGPCNGSLRYVIAYVRSGAATWPLIITTPASRGKNVTRERTILRQVCQSIGKQCVTLARERPSLVRRVRSRKYPLIQTRSFFDSRAKREREREGGWGHHSRANVLITRVRREKCSISTVSRPDQTALQSAVINEPARGIRSLRNYWLAVIAVA